MAVDHGSSVSASKSDQVFLHVKSGMTVIVTDTDGAWRMADVIWVDGGARNPKTPTLFQGSEAPAATERGRSGFGMQTAALPGKNYQTISSSFK